MAGSLKLCDSPSVDTQRPTSGLIGKAGKLPSQTTLHRRSLQVKFGKPKLLLNLTFLNKIIKALIGIEKIWKLQLMLCFL